MYGKLIRKGIGAKMTAAVAVAFQASVVADCHLCLWGCHATKHRCCPTVPCSTVCNEATFGYFPTPRKPWPMATVVTPAIAAPIPIPPPMDIALPLKEHRKKMPPISMQ
jgi:hypothetical protein